MLINYQLHDLYILAVELLLKRHIICYYLANQLCYPFHYTLHIHCFTYQIAERYYGNSQASSHINHTIQSETCSMPHNVDLAPTETTRSSRYRLTSLSSVADPYQQETITLHPKGELIGFRRLAKSFWYDFSGKSSKRSEVHTTTVNSSETSGSGPISPNNAIAFVTLDSTKVEQVSNFHYASPDTNILRSYFDPSDRYERHITYIDPSKSLVRDTRTTFPGNTLAQRKALAESKTTQANISLKYVDEFLKSSTFVPTRRVLHIRNLPSMIGLKAVLNQVSGGALQKIIIYRIDRPLSYERIASDLNTKLLLRNSVLELWFLKPQLALDFYQYSKSGLFMVNGFHFIPEWAPPHSCYDTDVDVFHEPVDSDIEEEVQKHSASRCLAMKRNPPKGLRISHSSSRHADPKTNYSSLDMDEIRMNFSQFGDIVEVCPLISKKLSFCVHYFDITSAIDAKRLFDDNTSRFHQSYPEWTLHYFKDMTDKPCLNV